MNEEVPIEYPWEVAVCINRDDRWDRAGHAKQEFKQVGIDVKFYNATRWEDLHPDSAKNLTKKVPQDHNLLGHVACGLTHKAAMQWAVSCGYESLCIFEDDIELDDRMFPTAVHWAMQSLEIVDPHWQFLYLGCRTWKGHPPKQLSPYVSEITHAYDAHAYVVREPLLAELVRDWDPLKKTTDWYFQENLTCKRYAPIPMVAWQTKRFMSDIDPTQVRRLL